MISFAEAITYVFSHNFLRFLSLLHTYQRWKGRAWLVMMARVMVAHSSFKPLVNDHLMHGSISVRCMHFEYELLATKWNYTSHKLSNCIE